MRLSKKLCGAAAVSFVVCLNAWLFGRQLDQQEVMTLCGLWGVYLGGQSLIDHGQRRRLPDDPQPDPPSDRWGNPGGPFAR